MERLSAAKPIYAAPVLSAVMCGDLSQMASQFYSSDIWGVALDWSSGQLPNGLPINLACIILSLGYRTDSACNTTSCLWNALWRAWVPSGWGQTRERGAWWGAWRRSVKGYCADHAAGRVKDTCSRKSQVFLSIPEEDTEKESLEQRKKKQVLIFS